MQRKKFRNDEQVEVEVVELDESFFDKEAVKIENRKTIGRSKGAVDRFLNGRSRGSKQQPQIIENVAPGASFAQILTFLPGCIEA